jgi:nicotinamide-nucleotide amidase
MLEDHVVPMLGSLFPVPGGRMKRVYRVIGLGESAVEEMVGLRILARGDVEVGYCARSNEVDVRLMGAPDPVAESGRWLEEALGDNLVSSDGSSLEENVFRLLAGRTLALAESCTGGLVASRLTDVPGASEVFRGGIVAYSNDLKCALLDVPETLVAAHGAVSAAVAAAMAEGVRRRLAAHYALSLTGIAGPTGATAGKPVGTLHIGFASASAPPQTFAEFFPTDRITFKQLAAKRALDILRRALLSGSVSA